MNSRRLTFVAAAAWLGLSACAVFEAGRGLQIGVSQGPDVIARQGQPSRGWNNLDGGSTHEYATQPFGETCFMYRLDATGKLVEFHDALLRSARERVEPGRRNRPILAQASDHAARGCPGHFAPRRAGGIDTHTADMLAHPRVSLLVMAEPGADTSALALPRVSLLTDAQTLPREGTEHVAERAAYLERFPDAALTFALGDFSLVALRPISARLVASFGRAHALAGQGLIDWPRP